LFNSTRFWVGLVVAVVDFLNYALGWHIPTADVASASAIIVALILADAHIEHGKLTAGNIFSQLKTVFEQLGTVVGLLQAGKPEQAPSSKPDQQQQPQTAQPAQPAQPANNAPTTEAPKEGGSNA